jgi:hypothetical protein
MNKTKEKKKETKERTKERRVKQKEGERARKKVGVLCRVYSGSNILYFRC